MVVTEAPSWIFVNDGYAAAMSGASLRCIQPVGVVPVTGSVPQVPGTDTQLFLVHGSNATVGTYEVLATSPTDGILKTDQGVATTSSSSVLQEWATEAGTMDGVSINAGQSMDFSINARRETDSSEDAHLELRFYHRTTGGTETLLDAEVLDDLTTTYQFFTGSWSVSTDQSFDTDELLVLKIILHNDGTPV